MDATSKCLDIEWLCILAVNTVPNPPQQCEVAQSLVLRAGTHPRDHSMATADGAGPL